ncbi:uncharacterized protein TRIREDRAFT_112651 [Trichoderma reesei QM6a]|uniref:Predicted protein n=1 Tax=Hypocrea jecorina (strain QM6a) TaxID=431241 RepID=G0RXL7_HYPJQ|nr:uncharacterized protein TRIREDRAFT_112651 [Trichoderma reesei QM6a]EGR44074.1 predicted protein [Trichoderma reesei QM6a]
MPSRNKYLKPPVVSYAFTKLLPSEIHKDREVKGIQDHTKVYATSASASTTAAAASATATSLAIWQF